jgi:phosphoglycolate phosphatase
MSRYSAIIFDFDGTLFDTRQAISKTLEETFRRLAVSSPDGEQVRQIISQGINLEETFRQLLPERAPDLAIEDCVQVYREIYNSGVGIEASVPFPETPGALAEIHDRRVPVAVVSNKGEESVLKILEFFELRSFVDLVVAAKDEHPTKPDPRTFHDRIRPQLGSEACERVLVVGDTDVDIRFAREIDAGACWAAYGYGSRAKCEALGPDHVVDSPKAVAGIL